MKSYTNTENDMESHINVEAPANMLQPHLEFTRATTQDGKEKSFLIGNAEAQVDPHHNRDKGVRISGSYGQRQLSYMKILTRIIDALASSAEDVSAALKIILTQLLEEWVTTKGYHLVFADVALIDGSQKLLLRQSVGKPEAVAEFQRFVAVLDIPTLMQRHEKIGMSGRAALTNHAQCAPNVRVNEDYIHCNASTRSAIAVPIFLHQEAAFAMGALNVEFENLDAFTEEDVEFLTQIAHFVAMEIRKRLHHQAVLETSRHIFSGIQQDFNLWLDNVLQHIVETLRYYKGAESIVGALYQAYDANDDSLRIEGAFLNRDFRKMQSLSVNGKRFLSKEARIGTTGRAVRLGKLYYAPDVGQDPYYFEVNPETRAQVAVALKRNDQVAGVLSVSSSQCNAFDDTDLKALEFIAEMMVTAFELRRLMEEAQANDLVARRTSLAWMGMANDMWRHDACKYAVDIRNEVELARYQLNKQSLPPQDLTAYLYETLDQIEGSCQRVMFVRNIPPLGSITLEEAVDLEEVLCDRLRIVMAKSDVDYGDSLPIEISKVNKRRSHVKVRTNPNWLRYAMDNFFKGLLESKSCNFASQANLVLDHSDDGKRVTMTYTDPWRTIAPEVSALLRKRLPKGKITLKHKGMELLLAKAVIESFNGSFTISSSQRGGLICRIELPSATKTRTRSKRESESRLLDS